MALARSFPLSPSHVSRALLTALALALTPTVKMLIQNLAHLISTTSFKFRFRLKATKRLSINDVRCSQFSSEFALPHYPHLGLITVLNSRSLLPLSFLGLSPPFPFQWEVGTSFMNGPWSKMSRDVSYTLGKQGLVIFEQGSRQTRMISVCRRDK